MQAVHWFLTALDRGTSALGTLVFGQATCGIEKSASRERSVFLGLMVQLMGFWRRGEGAPAAVASAA